VTAVGFQIVELETDGDVVKQRKVVPHPFPTFDDAKLQVERVISKYAESGYSEEHAYWWFRTLDGESARLLIEGV
jgi:hypothetical protein